MSEYMYVVYICYHSN